MNTKLFTPLILGISMIFLMQTVSAVVVYGDWQDGGQSITITQGQDVDFAADFFSMSPPMTINVKLYDSSDDSLVHSFENNKVVSSNGFAQTYTITETIYETTGNFEVVLSASDAFPSSDSHTISLTVNPEPNNPPIAQDQSVTTDFETPVTINLQATDADGDDLTFSVVSQPANGVYTFNPDTGGGTYVPDNGFSGSDSFSFRAFDGTDYSNTATVIITVNPAPMNNPPVITSTPITQVNESELYEYQVTATDEDGDTLVYSLTTAPSWLSIDSSTGLISGTAPVVSADTDFDVVISVTDGTDSDSQNYVVTVFNVPVPNNPPVITSGPVREVNENTQYVYQVTATDADNDTLTFSISTDADWLSIDTDTGLVTGTAPAVSSDTDFNVTVVVSDGIDITTQTYVVTVFDVTAPPTPEPDRGTTKGGGTRVIPVSDFEQEKYLEQFEPVMPIELEEEAAPGEERPSALTIILLVLFILVFVVLAIIILNLLRR